MPTTSAAGEPRILTSEATMLGFLTIEEVEVPMTPACHYRVRIGGRLVLETDCRKPGSAFSSQPIPSISRRFSPGPAPFEEVFLFRQQMLGQACPFGSLWFLGVRRDGFKVSAPIENCAVQPTFRRDGERITIFLPEHPRGFSGERVPGEAWAYEGGAVTRVPMPR